MHERGDCHFAGAQVDIAEDKTDEEGIEKLIDIRVVEGEQQRGDHHGELFTVAACAVDEQLAEKPFLTDRREDHGDEE